jgi:hypothetical protein
LEAFNAPVKKVVLLCVKTVKRGETLAKRFSETVHLAIRNIKAAHRGPPENSHAVGRIPVFDVHILRRNLLPVSR